MYTLHARLCEAKELLMYIQTIAISDNVLCWTKLQSKSFFAAYAWSLC